MDDLTLRYYEAEMRYLREAGKEFARAHPDRAALLNIDRVGKRDPYVERLFEGFAFLTGRIRQKLDDDFPELTEGLVNMLWPHYLRMVPSLTVLELRADAHALQQAKPVEAGLSVLTSPVGANAVRCAYRTTQAAMIRPLLLCQAGTRLDGEGRSVLELRFDLGATAKREALDLSRLRLFLDADPPIAFALRHALTRQLGRARLRPLGRAGYPVHEMPTLRFEPVGFNEADRLWPKADNAFGGYQLLLEYFCFREKFQFLDLAGLDAALLPGDSTGFTLELTLTQRYPADMPFNADNLRLHCVPAINLFPMEAEPLHVNHLNHEYRVVPLASQGPEIEAWSVDEVVSMDTENGGRHAYLPFTSFQHRGGMLRDEAPERFYHARTRLGAAGRPETWLALGGHLWDSPSAAMREEILSLRVTGTNGMLPRKALREAQILERSAAPPLTQIANLTAPTLPCYPPAEDRYQWRVLSHLAPNFLSPLNVEVLRGTLALYDWTEDELNRQRLNGLLEVRHQLVSRVKQGCMERGVRIELTVDRSGFAGPGDIHLFGDLMHRFFAAYADMNLFTRFELRILPENERVRWPDSKTEAPPL